MRHILPRVRRAAIAAILFAIPAATGQAAPRTVVDGFHATLLETMKHADSLGIKGRYRALEPALESAFDLRLMVAIATGRYWRAANPEQRDRLARAFERFSVATYASRFASHSGEAFETRAVRGGPRKTTLVDTEIRRVNDSPVPITYVLKQSDGRWRIVDVVVSSGISELAVRRSEYAGTLQTGGIDALIDALDRKADALVRE